MNTNCRATLLPAALLCLLTASWAHAATLTSSPAGYNSHLSYFANGQYNIFSPSPDPNLVNCFLQFCDGEFFLQQVQGYSSDEIAQIEADAKAFFLWRFGIDVDDPANIGRLTFQSFQLDPRNEYRAYLMSGAYVPDEGFEVRDGGFGITITDPNGYELGGEFAGVTIPRRSTMGYGEYNIAVVRQGQVVREVDISYRAGAALVANEFGLVPFFCEIHTGRLIDNDFSNPNVAREGVAQGLAFVVDQGDGTFKVNFRNSLTFNQDFGGL